MGATNKESVGFCVWYQRNENCLIRTKGSEELRVKGEQLATIAFTESQDRELEFRSLITLD